MGVFASTVTYFTIKIPKRKKKLHAVGYVNSGKLLDILGYIAERDAHLVYVNCHKQQPVNKGVVWQNTSKASIFFWKGIE